MTLISNYVPREEIDYYTKPNGIEVEAKLTKDSAQQLHFLIRQSNIHPVKILLHACQNKKILQNSEKVCFVLESLCAKEMKKTDTNELLALKYHYIGFIIRIACDALTKLQPDFKTTKEFDQENVHLIIKSWLKGRENDGFPLTLEKILRQSIREFNYRESGLFMQLIRTLSTTEIGEEPSALALLTQAITGQKGYLEDTPVCSTCGEPNPSKRCSGCKISLYCNQSCQKLHWSSHKKVCANLKTSAIESAKKEATVSNKEQTIADSEAN